MRAILKPYCQHFNTVYLVKFNGPFLCSQTFLCETLWHDCAPTYCGAVHRALTLVRPLQRRQANAARAPRHPKLFWQNEAQRPRAAAVVAWQQICLTKTVPMVLARNAAAPFGPSCSGCAARGVRKKSKSLATSVPHASAGGSFSAPTTRTAKLLSTYSHNGFIKLYVEPLDHPLTSADDIIFAAQALPQLPEVCDTARVCQN